MEKCEDRSSRSSMPGAVGRPGVAPSSFQFYLLAAAVTGVSQRSWTRCGVQLQPIGSLRPISKYAQNGITCLLGRCMTLYEFKQLVPNGAIVHASAAQVS